jgi:ABC-2 type transport system permease protein
MRNQSLFEMWWLFTTLMRYPKDIFRGGRFATWTGWFFSFAVPIMLVSNVPSQSMVKLLEPEMIAYMFAATAVVLFVSRRVFRLALQKYRSASS